MKKVIGVLALCLALSGCQQDKEVQAEKSEVAAEVAQEQTVAAPGLTEFNEKLGYSVGLDIGKSLKALEEALEAELPLDAVYAGIEDQIKGNEPKIAAEEATAVQQQFAQQMQMKQMQKMIEMQAENLEKATKFLEENKMKEGVVVTESGLQYEVLVQGDGPKPTAEDIVKVDYVGTLIDGTEFDSSISRGEPAVFGLSQVITGWSEAVQLMPVGSKFRFVLPPEIAYGEQGAPPVIEPNSALVFEVELHSIEAPVETPEGQTPIEGGAEEAPAEPAS